MKRFSILLLIAISAQALNARSVTKSARIALITSRLLHKIPKAPYTSKMPPYYNINEQNKATQIRAAITEEIRNYEETINDIRYELLQAYRTGNNIKATEERTIYEIGMVTKSHLAKMKTLEEQLKKETSQ